MCQSEKRTGLARVHGHSWSTSVGWEIQTEGREKCAQCFWTYFTEVEAGALRGWLALEAVWSMVALKRRESEAHSRKRS